jgi:hypothetical protein
LIEAAIAVRIPDFSEEIGDPRFLQFTMKELVV